MLYQFTYTALEEHANPFRWIDGDSSYVAVPEDVLENEFVFFGFSTMGAPTALSGPPFLD